MSEEKKIVSIGKPTEIKKENDSKVVKDLLATIEKHKIENAKLVEKQKLAAEKAKEKLAEIKEKAATNLENVKEALKKAKEANKAEEVKQEKELVKQAKSIVERANIINETLENLSDTERNEFYDELNAQTGMVDHLERHFPTARSVKAAAIVPSDLPNSAIITNLPIRVIEQAIKNIVVKYPLMDLVHTEKVMLATKQLFYKKYTDTDNESGYSDVKISDYNKGGYLTFTETIHVKDEISKGYDILSSVLNEVTLTTGLFISLINDFIYAIARPIAKKMYARFMTFLDETTSYDEVIDFTGTDAKAKAKEVYEKLVELETPSFTHLKTQINGAVRNLEFQLPISETYLVINKKYASNYKYDLAAGTFQNSEIKLQVKGIKVLDFDKLSEYSENKPSSVLKSLEVIIMQPKTYFEFIHYQASKNVQTPKLKTVFNRYDRLGNGRYKNKYLAAFKNK